MKLHRIVALLLGALPTLMLAQPSAHYPPGVEGIKGASLPPPGFYVRDYNLFYFADQINDHKGDNIDPLDVDAFIYANVPRLVWITKAQVLGGFLGVDALIPLQYTQLQIDPGIMDDDVFGAADLFVEGTWSKHIQQWDFSAGYGIWAPTGDHSNRELSVGSGFWTHMFTAGLTFYPDVAKKWSVSALSRYEINTEKENSDVTPGQVYTLEWGISRALTKTIEAGVVGYYQQQVTEDTHGMTDHRDMVASIGPEIATFCPKLGLFTSLRYLYEFAAEDRMQGHAVVLTFTKRL